VTQRPTMRDWLAHGEILSLFALLFMAFPLVAQTTPAYDTLVRKGNTQLQASDNDTALANAQSAIKLNPDRWEAYALAGGALMNLKRYEEAADDFSKAIERAHEPKQAGLRDLRKKCLVAEAESAPGTAPLVSQAATSATNSGNSTSAPSYEDTVHWIQQGIRGAGFPPGTVMLDGGATELITDDAPYVLKLDGCNMSLSVSQRLHLADQSSTTSYTINVPLNKGVSVEMNPQILPVQAGFYPSGATATFGPLGNGDNYPTVFIVLPDDGGGATWSRIMTTTTPYAAVPNIVDKPLGTWWPKTKIKGGDLSNPVSIIEYEFRGIRITYARPGAGDSPKHMINALHHLLDLCTEDPNRGPKSIF
jgi:hypothetical protein